jgi:hypothetical protein
MNPNTPATEKNFLHRIVFFCLVAVATLTTGTLAAIVQTTQTTDQAPGQIKTQPGAKGQEPSPASITPSPTEAPETHSWTVEQIIPLTVSEAWEFSGKNEDKFFDIVQDLAAFSAQKRGLTLPENEAAGRQAGQFIKAKARADHDELLYAIVDQAVRKVGTRNTATK